DARLAEWLGCGRSPRAGRAGRSSAWAPPLIVPVSQLAGGQGESSLESLLGELRSGYSQTLAAERRALLERFHYADLARKVVGVGSVGTRCWVMLLLGGTAQDPLFLQIKEAQASVLEPLLGESHFATAGERIVEGQRLMQAASDIFLGWVHSDAAIDGGARDFYVRHLWGWKVSLEVETIQPRGLSLYATACGWTLARAHARSGDPIAIAAYLGGGDTFDRAVAEFAASYADLNERDHHALERAVADGKVDAVTGV